MSSINLWSDTDALKIVKKYEALGFCKDLSLRTYSARLLGSDPELVLHGGGNTSVKSTYKDFHGNQIPILFIKGSGWDLGTIEPQGHPAVKLLPLQELRKIKQLSDEDMVSIQRQNLINPNSPNPSVEALLHAFLPHKFIDHTHSASILALANQPDSENLIKKIFGHRLAIIPYIKPGFDLAISASDIFEKTEKLSKDKGIILEGMILINHGIFTFGNSAKESYERMISVVSEASNYLPRKINLNLDTNFKSIKKNNNLTKTLPLIRGLIGRYAMKYGETNKWILDVRNNKNIEELLNHPELNSLVKRGVATPDHVIRTKSRPLLLQGKTKEENFDLNKWFIKSQKELEKYIKHYLFYFESNNKRVGNNKKLIDPIPRIILLPGLGLISCGKDKSSAKVNGDIAEAWIETLLSAESIGTFSPVGIEDTFDLEYWSLEQAKLGKVKSSLFSGQIVAVTGAGGTIGSKIAKDFADLGAEIISIDKDKLSAQKTAAKCGKNAKSFDCDVTDFNQLNMIFDQILMSFGGLDILVSNAGSAWQGKISTLEDKIFRDSMELNLFSHHYASQNAIKIFRLQDYLEPDRENFLGGQLLFNVSKQAINPGDSFGAYGVSKAALLALVKQYALEEGENKIRSNGVNADRIRSGLLTNEMINKRSKSRGITESEYMSGNLLRSEVKPKDVSQAFISLALAEKTTGALLTVDGGNVSAMLR